MKRVKFPIYFLRIENYGDLLNELIPEKLFPIKVVPEPFSTADISGIGSILDHLLDNNFFRERDQKFREAVVADRPIHVWGTGLMFRYDPAEQKALRPLIIHALRGEYTKELMSAILGRQIDCVLADPGLLASRVVPAEEKVYNVGIVPHIFDRKDPIIAALEEHYENSIIIDAREPSETVLRKISQCRRLISTGLHGLIVADSYNIPNCWCEASDKVEGAGFKFHDYFSSFGTDREPFDLRTGAFPDLETDFTTSFSDYKQVRKKQNELIRCFPHRFLYRAYAREMKKSVKKKLKKALKKVLDR